MDLGTEPHIPYVCGQVCEQRQEQYISDFWIAAPLYRFSERKCFT